MTKRLQKLIKKRNKAWKNFKNNPQYHKLDDYKNKRNQVTKTILSNKRTFEENLANRIKTDPKAFYAYVKSKTNLKDRIGPIQNSADVLISDNKEKCEILNDYFSSVFTEENCTNIHNLTLTSNCNTTPQQELTSITLNEERILLTIRSLKSNKSGGTDEINSSYLIGIAEAVTKPLLLLFNSSIETGVIPEDWKNANVTPIFKKGSKRKPENYRPISLTSHICKTLERIISQDIDNHLVINNLITQSQHGF